MIDNSKLGVNALGISITFSWGWLMQMTMVFTLSNVASYMLWLIFFCNVQSLTDHFWPQSPDLSQNLRRRWCYPLGSSDLVGLRLAQLCLAWISVCGHLSEFSCRFHAEHHCQYCVGLPGGVAGLGGFEITWIILASSANKKLSELLMQLGKLLMYISCWL